HGAGSGVMSTRETFLQLALGEVSHARHPSQRMLAVARGRVRVALAGEREPALLRPSDAFAIPARTVCTIEALQAAELYWYAEPAVPALWGV
ncbi:MAG: hypothetical protein ACRD1E_09915, partial [Terriglobales bacterium]